MKGFAEADAYCVTEANANGYMNGCTAVIALVLDGVLHIANLGDSEAILVGHSYVFFGFFFLIIFIEVLII